MASKPRTSRDIPSLTLEVLKDIRSEMREVKGEIVEMKGEIVQMKGDIVEMKGDIVEMKGDIRGLRSHVRTLGEATIAGFIGVRRELDRLGQRVDGLRDVDGHSWREHDARLGDLEVRVQHLKRVP